MTPGEVRVYHQGRADLFVALAAMLGWSDGKTFGIGRRFNVTPADIRAAWARAQDCAEPDEAP